MKTVILVGSHGYIGSAISADLADNIDIQLIRCDESLDPGNDADFPLNSAELDIDTIHRADIVLFFGGCSSVASALHDPARAVSKNVLELVDLARRLNGDQLLIYASSASVYSSPQTTDSDTPAASLSSENAPLRPPTNAYDATKQAFDLIAPHLLVPTVGLRMGTLSGMSRRLRPELVFNAMTASALKLGTVRLQNPRASRSILFLDDLVALLRAIIIRPELVRGVPILNVASLSASFGELAERIAGRLDARVELLPDSATYSFAIDTSLLRSLVGDSVSDLDDQVDKFRFEFELAP